MYTWFPLATPADLARLASHIAPEYAPEKVAKKLEAGLSSAVKAILIEHDYIDKDYRSTYYNYYVKKGRRYRADCVRLHFFDQTVAFNETRLCLVSENDPDLTDHYFGFMVLRPTGIATIGRSVLSPDVRRGASRYIITASHKVHLLGHKLTTHGFPSMDQHTDISVCAHSACWSIIRHYSERYNIYRECLTHDITLMAQQFDPGGLLPSQGLALSHAERIFQVAGTFPIRVIRDLDEEDDPSFYRQLTAYVDSGFPLFAAMHSEGHAVVVVGFDWRTSTNSGTPGMRYSWDEITELAVVDDNYLPYLPMSVDGSDYNVSDIDAFIVALPEKVFYPADAFDDLIPNLFALGTVLHLPPPEKTIIRYFITTGSAFRKFVRDHESEYDPELLAAVMQLPFAQFIWIVEFATEKQWAVNQISGRAIVDATASHTELYPFWIFHCRKRAIVLSRETVSPDYIAGMGVLSLADTGHSGFSRMDTNMRATKTK